MNSKKSIQDILRENGVQRPPDQLLDIPELEEPECRKKRWLTINDLICGGGWILETLGAILQYLIAIFFWLMASLVLLQFLIQGCLGSSLQFTEIETKVPRSLVWQESKSVSISPRRKDQIVSVLSIGATGTGKSNDVLILTHSQLDENTVAVVLDPQPGATAKKFAQGCAELNTPCIYENTDRNRLMNCNFLQPSNDARIDERNIASFLDAIGSYRGIAHAYSRVLTMQFARPMCLVKMYSGLPWHRLHGAWNSDTNYGLIKRCNHDDCTKFLRSLPTTRSPLNRELDPAKRFLEPVTHGPSMRIRDSKEDRFIEALNAGFSIAVDGGRVISPRELCFLCSFRLMQIFRAAIEGRLTKNLIVVIEEAEIQGVPIQVARAIQGLRKFGVSLYLIAQNGDFGDEDNKTEIIWNNTGRLWHRCSSPAVLEKAAQDLESLIDPYFVKRKRQFFRQALVGYTEIETKSKTTRDSNDGSETIGSRLHPKYHQWIETVDEFMPKNEQATLLKGVISRLGIGCGISKLDGEIDTFQLPRYEEWLNGKKSENMFRIGFERILQPSDSWLKEISPTTPNEQETTLTDWPDEDSSDPWDFS